MVNTSLKACRRYRQVFHGLSEDARRSLLAKMGPRQSTLVVRKCGGKCEQQISEDLPGRCTQQELILGIQCHERLHVICRREKGEMCGGRGK